MVDEWMKLSSAEMWVAYIEKYQGALTLLKSEDLYVGHIYIGKELIATYTKATGLSTKWVQGDFYAWAGRTLQAHSMAEKENNE